jgi:hypothetical protein
MAGMTEKQATERLREFESRHGLYAVLLDGWSPWRTLRFHLTSQLMKLPLASGDGSGTARRSLRAFGGSLKLALTLLRGARVDGIVKSFSSALREPAGGKFRDVYFDSLLDLGLRCFKIEAANARAFEANRRRALRPADLDAEIFRFWGRALATLLPRRECDAFFDQVAANLRAELGVELPAAVMRRAASSTWWQIRLYRWLLRRLRARFVIVADSCEYPFEAACRREGVKFIELQHGIFGQHHPDALPSEAPGGPEELMLPQVLAVFGEYWRARLAGTALARIDIVPVGSSQIERARKLRASRQPSSRRRLLVTSQGLDTPRLCAWLQGLLATVPRDLDFELGVKLHPAYDDPARAEFAALAAHPSVRIIAGADLPDTYELLAQADLHLSIASACHFDALGIGVPTVIIPLTGHEAMLELVDGVSVYLAREPSDVWSVPATPVAFERAAQFYAPGFTDNLRRLIA